ncbi:MAG TPA: RdgB/HAM1 family non-canonical purine NTP pyrophosphatase [Crenotrichaceae bacterium]|nr:RdgB/HAM1 family non-canonical purine NTP pyrophosphatase [Crenotrichaceae bacterium]
MDGTVVLASGNPGKIREFQAVLKDFHLKPQSEFTVPEVEETGLSFVENALIKARNASRHTGLPALADDSGLVVDALSGAPGIYSARYAGIQATDQENLDQLLIDLENVADAKRTARFVCVLAFCQYPADPIPVIAQGIWEGTILREQRGVGGFGYDPVFYVPETQCASAELSAEQKNAISHRGQALIELCRLLANIQLADSVNI